MFKYLFTAIIGITLLVGCQKGVDDNGGSNSLPAQTLADVSYGTDAKQKMDIYLPAGRTSSSTKVIIMIHGGAWSSGDKTDLSDFVDSIKRRLPDWAIINVNHRLSTGLINVFPAQEYDIDSAIHFIVSKTGEYHISQKFVYLGASSGAHLALLQGYKNTSAIKPKAIADFFGPTDLVDLYNNTTPIGQPLLASIIGGTPTTNPTAYQQASPINFVTAQSPPTIIFHGGLDPVVPPAESVALAAKLQLMGVVNQYAFYPTETHGIWTSASLFDAFNKLQVFLAANVN